VVTREVCLVRGLDSGQRRSRWEDARVRRRVLLDLSPLRESREFRLLWSGQAISMLGRQVTVVAVPYQTYLLTHSSFMVGLVSLAQLPVLIVGSLFGGAIADAVDRRRLLLVMQVLLAATSVGLALNTTGGQGALWPVFVMTVLAAGFSGIDNPARAASIPRLVRREQFAAASALNQTLFQTALVAGPALGGLLIARVSLSAAYWADVVTFAAAGITVLRMRPMPPQGGGTRVGFSSVAEGLRFLRGLGAVKGGFLIDINAMVFGMPRALFPELGTRVFHGGAATVGLLNAAPGAGALVAALTTGWVSSVRRPGRMVVLAVIVWGLAIAGAGAVPWLVVGLLLLALAGAADVVSAVFRGTILQLSVPDRLRGRLSAVNIAVVTGGPRLGDLESGAVSSVTNARFSFVSGGLVCAAGAMVIGRLMPALSSWTMDDGVGAEVDADANPA
jgi:MFS family permease